jgi:hypothetical protein
VRGEEGSLNRAAESRHDPVLFFYLQQYIEEEYREARGTTIKERGEFLIIEIDCISILTKNRKSQLLNAYERTKDNEIKSNPHVMPFL